jgi:hypothetical protein
MTKSKPVRGLLDYISLKPGEKPEWEPISESYVPGMGLGASKDAIRWAYKGYLVERYQHQEKIIAQIKAQMKQNTKIGPPKKTPEFRVDNLRAYYLWFLVRDWAARIYDIELSDDALWPMSRARDQAIRLNRLSQNRLRRRWHQRLCPEPVTVSQARVRAGK